MVEGRSGRAFADWLAARPESFRDNVQVVVMDAFAGYKRAAARQAPRAAEILDPFHVVQLAGQKLTKVRCRLRRETAGRRGTRSDSLYRCGRILLKTESPRTDRQREKADEILADPANGPLRLAHGACKGCPELSVLGRTMKKRMRDILAFFDWDNNANGPTEAINGRLETLRGIALGHQPGQLRHPQSPARRRLQIGHPTAPPITHPYTPKPEEQPNCRWCRPAGRCRPGGSVCVFKMAVR